MYFGTGCPCIGITANIFCACIITSTFTIIVEYVFAVPSDLIAQIQEGLSKEFEREDLEVVLQEFK